MSLMMIHAATLCRGQDGSCSQSEFMVPPVVLTEITASALVSGFDKRLGNNFETVAQQATRSCRIVASDSAKACGKVGTHYSEGVRQGKEKIPTLHSRCMMHMMFMAVVSMLALHGLITNMFCAAVLCHKHSTTRLLRKHKQSNEQKQ